MKKKGERRNDEKHPPRYAHPIRNGSVLDIQRGMGIIQECLMGLGEMGVRGPLGWWNRGPEIRYIARVIIGRFNADPCSAQQNVPHNRPQYLAHSLCSVL